MNKPEKILLIRMAETADVLSIGLPALRFVRETSPDAELHILTHGEGAGLINWAEPSVTVHHLPDHIWPQDILKGMETFLGMAETIIGNDFTQIINLDTAFLPCFLARFLKDAGENVAGNWLSMSVAELIEGLEKQTLSEEYVHDSANYIQSSWLSMQQWNTRWWLHGSLPEYGYAEFFLKRCCGFSNLTMNMQLPVTLEPVERKVAVYLPDYPHTDSLCSALKAKGIAVYRVPEDALNPKVAAAVQRCAMMVTQPALSFWLARAVNTPVLLVSGDMDPRVLMPDYATDQSTQPIAVEQLLDGIITLAGGIDEA